jgi:ubiquilin
MVRSVPKSDTSGPAATPSAAAATTARSPLAPAVGATATPALPAPAFANPMMNPLAGMGAGAMGDPNTMMNMLNNPAMMQSVTQMMANPQFMDMMASANPSLAGMLTPEMRQMMQTDEFRNMLSNPMFMQMAMSGAMGGMGGGMGGMGMSGMGLGAMGGLGQMPGQTAAAPTQNTQPPEERFQVQLQQLREMGFYDPTENVRVLQMTNGNVEAAIEYLFSRR